MTRPLHLLCLAALALPGVAAAQFWIPVADPCLVATTTWCRRPEALTGSCAARCRDVLRADFFYQSLLAPQTLVTVPEQLPGANTRTLAALTTDPVGSHFMVGGTTTSALVLERQKTTYLSSGGGLGLPTFFDPHQAWRTNGARVASCDELVFDTFRNFSDFEDANRGAKALDLFRAAYAPGGIAFQELRDANGMGRGPFPTQGYQPKNAYFTPLDLRMPDGSTSSLTGWNTALAPWDTTARWDWSSHRMYGNWFSWFYTPDHLDSLYAEQQDYLGRLRGRTLRYQQYEQENATCVAAHSVGHPDCVALRTQATNDLSILDFAIGFELVAAEKRGALSPSIVNPWDWSPLFFASWLENNISREREPVRALCMRVSSGDFRTGVVSRVLPGGEGLSYPGSTSIAVAPADWLATPGEANAMLALIENFARNLDVPRDPATGKATLYQLHSDHAQLGNDRFGVSYDWRMGWGLTNLETRLCEAQLDVQGSFNSSASVLGASKSLLEVEAHAWSENSVDVEGGTDLLTRRRISVLGTNIYGPLDTRGPLTFHLSASPSRKDELQLAVIVVPVLGVPVKVAGGISGTEGLAAEVTGGLTRTCAPQQANDPQGHAGDSLDVGVEGSVKPFISMNGWASASVDALVLEVGVKGEVTLVKAELPLTLRVQTRFQGTPNLSLEAETRLALSLSSLDGRVSVYGRVFGRSAERELVSWSGPHLVDTTLFELRYVPAVRFDVLQLASRIPGY